MGPAYVASGLDALEGHANSCRRCAGDELAPAKCAPCRHEVETNRARARHELIDDDDLSHAIEERRIAGLWHDMAEDEWPDLPVMGGA